MRQMLHEYMKQNTFTTQESSDRKTSLLSTNSNNLDHALGISFAKVLDKPICLRHSAAN